MSFKVNFIGIGAAKCGSTWLAALLDQHPEVSFPQLKEATYFNKYEFDGQPNKRHDYPLSFYQNLWKDKSGNTLGEWSPQYLFDKEAARSIYQHNPKVKLLVVLRNPINRAYSHFIYDQNFNENIPTDLNFEQAYKEYPYLLEVGRYARQLQVYFDLFPRKNIRVWVLEDAIQQEEATAKEMYEFIGVSSGFLPDFSPQNESKRIKHRRLNWLLSVPGKLKRGVAKSTIGAKGIERFEQSKLHHRLFYWKTKLKDLNVEQMNKRKMDPAVYDQLMSYYHEDMVQLEEMGIDISAWKSPS